MSQSQRSCSLPAHTEDSQDRQEEEGRLLLRCHCSAGFVRAKTQCCSPAVFAAWRNAHSLDILRANHTGCDRGVAHVI